jgi:hypothetical protein
MYKGGLVGWVGVLVGGAVQTKKERKGESCGQRRREGLRGLFEEIVSIDRLSLSHTVSISRLLLINTKYPCNGICSVVILRWFFFLLPFFCSFFDFLFFLFLVGEGGGGWRGHYRVAVGCLKGGWLLSGVGVSKAQIQG